MRSLVFLAACCKTVRVGAAEGVNVRLHSRVRPDPSFKCHAGVSRLTRAVRRPTRPPGVMHRIVC
jgi:hypothetical protein